jgi:hypothetical protein
MVMTMRFLNKRFRIVLAAAILFDFGAAVYASPSEPTNDEQMLIELINRARHNAPKYAIDFGLSVPLTDATPQPPLAVNTSLVGSARFHANEMATYNYFDHQSAVTGDWPNKMAHDNGYPLPGFWELDNNYIESIAAGTTTPEHTLDILLVDEGIDPPGHRIHLLGMHEFFATHDEIGAGHAFNSVSTYRNYWAIHTALDEDTRKFVTGVVYNDTTPDHFYTAGEGLAAVTVEALTPGTTNVIGSTTTFASGGYSLKLANGPYDIRFSGGALAEPITHKSVVVGPNNAKIDSLSLWNQNADGVWGVAANWLGGVPNGTGTTAVFQSETAVARTITVGTMTTGHVKFDNSGGVSLVATGTLELDVAAGEASISAVGAGSHSIRTDVNFNDDAVLSVDSGGTLEFSLANIRNRGKVIRKTGEGSLEIGGKLNADAGSVLRAEEGVTDLFASVGAPTSRTLSLAITGEETLLNIHSPQYLDILAIDGGTIRLAPGGTTVVTLNELVFTAPAPALSAVPEPSTALLLAIPALIGAASFLTRKKKQDDCRRHEAAIGSDNSKQAPG